VALVQRTIAVIDGMTQVRDLFALGHTGAAVGIPALRLRTTRTGGVIVVVTAPGEGENGADDDETQANAQRRVHVANLADAHAGELRQMVALDARARIASR
jgi:hypothetical protein